MGDLKFPCSLCGQHIACDESLGGVTVSCPSCQASVSVPSAQDLQSIKAQDVFVSYRREGGEHLARLVVEALRQRGFSVFVDMENLQSGEFSLAILRKIELATDVIVICTKGCFDHSQNDDDWMRQEIRHAIRQDKNIVPIFDRYFIKPDPKFMPSDIAEVFDYNGLTPASDLWEASMDRLVTEFLESKSSILPTKGSLAPAPGKAHAILSGLVACFGLIMGIASIPFVSNPAVTGKFPHLCVVCKVMLFFVFLLNVLILAGAGMTFALKAAGVKLTRDASSALILSSTCCCLLFIVVARNYGFPSSTAIAPGLLWLVTSLPLVFVIRSAARLRK